MIVTRFRGLVVAVAVVFAGGAQVAAAAPPMCPALVAAPAPVVDRAGMYAFGDDGSNQRYLGAGVAAGMSPDGQQVAFYGPDGQLCIGPTAGGPSTLVKGRLPGNRVPANTRAEIPWSPDGARLLVVRGDGSNNEVFIADLETNKLRRVTPGAPVQFDAADWAPDSRRVAIAGPDGISIVAARNGRLLRTLPVGGDIEPYRMQWAPLTNLIFVRVSLVGDLLVPASGAAPIAVTNPDQQYDWRADLSAAVKGYNGLKDLNVRLPDGTHRPLGLQDSGSVFEAGEPRWTADGQRVLYLAKVSTPFGELKPTLGFLRADGSGGAPLFETSNQSGGDLVGYLTATASPTLVVNVQART